jgi:hypothetical protein
VVYFLPPLLFLQLPARFNEAVSCYGYFAGSPNYTSKQFLNPAFLDFLLFLRLRHIPPPPLPTAPSPFAKVIDEVTVVTCILEVFCRNLRHVTTYHRNFSCLPDYDHTNAYLEVAQSRPIRTMTPFYSQQGL